MKIISKEKEVHFDLEMYQISNLEISRMYEKLNETPVTPSAISDDDLTMKANPHAYEINTSLIEICQQYASAFSELFTFPYVMLAVSEQGRVIFVSGDEDTLIQAERENMRVGTSILFQDAGVNPFSAVMEFSKSIYVQREEQWTQSFGDWDILCFPIKVHMHTYASVGFMFPSSWPGKVILPLLKAVAMEILRFVSPHIQQPLVPGEMILSDKLKQFDLTPREQDIAEYWILDYNYKQISKAVGISENTVRVLVSRINLKMNVNSKASMILKLLGII